jgi:hypothetical protein
MKYHLRLRAQYLGRLCMTWQSKIRSLPAGNSMSDDSWGPNAVDLAKLRSFEFQESTAEAESDDEWDMEEDYDADDVDRAELLESIELNALADSFRNDMYLDE